MRLPWHGLPLTLEPLGFSLSRASTPGLATLCLASDRKRSGGHMRWVAGAILMIFSCDPVTAQITSLSPDLIVNCPNGALPCTIASRSPIVEHAEQNLKLDRTYIGMTVARSCTPTVCATGMKDTVVDPSVIGKNNSFSVCTGAGWDTISAVTPVINGAKWIALTQWQCADFLSDGTTYLVVLSWQAGNNMQKCPTGQHMISASPFRCGPP